MTLEVLYSIWHVASESCCGLSAVTGEVPADCGSPQWCSYIADGLLQCASRAGGDVGVRAHWPSAVLMNTGLVHVQSLTDSGLRYSPQHLACEICPY